ncbi:hypothetical protein [Haliea salexigens]|jgi:hypothetical protein|uniref:hypothetical protein n=1 Tax=Haliea salexigens TaxID=287487 RepID=UPI000404265B|nr:hypothetical protein [Haliea salexigens]|tara:strand:+ start:42228 stop:42503 length:276 start_codon:yes stop_codon:yes gene_type:complete
MDAKIIVALVVIIAVAAHVVLYRWVKFKIQEGVILQFLRDAREEGAPDHHHVDAIAAHTGLSVARVKTVCEKSKQVLPDPAVAHSWRGLPL